MANPFACPICGGPLYLSTKAEHIDVYLVGEDGLLDKQEHDERPLDDYLFCRRHGQVEVGYERDGDWVVRTDG